jgi:ribosome assembly protein YihI (activator of Der GTPase)
MNLVLIHFDHDKKEYETLTEEDVLHQLKEALLAGKTVWTIKDEYWIDDAGD